MSTITKEWLRSQISAIKTVGITDSNTLKAFEIALASLEAEPVGFIARHKETGKFGSYLHPKADWFKNDEYEVLSSYTAPPAPVFDRQAICDKVHGKCSRIPGATFYNAAEFAIDEMEACLAAMLQGAEPVMTAYKLPFEQWLSQQGERIEIDCGCVSVEVFMHWLRMAYGAGNSPVIPDGWVDCSERMPEENSEQEVLACFKGGDISTLYYFEGRWDDAYGIVPIRQDVTHWMPLPAAPQQEVKP
ncbi:MULTISPECIES: DUF551 domain-containing protein [Enterobacter]|uniref:DUF551 domain-containing protein n=1 Tax=Enterobacter TaxID=547 RepID=UPI001CC0216A|nr:MULTISPECIES: DUF551 domain-containing protein [Enterobacter]